MTIESQKPKLILDTKPLIKLFASEAGWENVQRIMLLIENGDIEAGISVVTLTEIYYKYSHENRVDLAKARIADVRYAAAIKKYVIDEKIAAKASEFKGKYSIPIADAFISATAYYNNSIVISDDIDFAKIKEVTVQTEQEFLSPDK
ncbi:MAG: PIN domain-containing protein [Candidatus Bathyarchaeia archaeon]